MTESSVIDLRSETTWFPGELVHQAFAWPTSEPVMRLAELIESLVPDTFVSYGHPVISPQSVDPESGGVRSRTRNYQGSAYLAGAAPNDVHPGDVLIPHAPDMPVMLVDHQLAGAAFTTGFTACRPRHEVYGAWIWGVLNSRSGIAARRRYALRAGRKATALSWSDLAIPVPPLAAQREAVDDEAASQVHDVEEAAATWWRTTDLRRAEWRLALASPEPEFALDGRPLGELAAVRTGRTSRPEAVQPVPTPDHLPVADVRFLRERRLRRWVPEAEAVRVEAGDVLVAAAGERAHAHVADEPMALASTVLSASTENPSDAEGLARYLNGPQGYARRRILLTGSAIQVLRRADLERLGVPDGALQVSEPSEPLSARLEAALWNR